MDGAWLTRMRWRRRGAWMWPAFVALTVVDAFVVHALPPDGDSEGLVRRCWFAGFWNFLAVAVSPIPSARSCAGSGGTCRAPWPATTRAPGS
jgi:hypothetical protein